MAALVEMVQLKKYFQSPRGTVHAVDDVSMSILKGMTMGVVGESGCGKSTLGRLLVHLEDITSGRVLFNGEDVTFAKGGRLRAQRQQVQMIFQDSYSSLNARKTVEETISEPLILSKRYKKHEVWQKTKELMDTVGIAMRLRMSYPHELDGGRRQRVGVARAIALDPEFIVCDEPVSSLDVSIQAQILNLLRDLQREKKLTYMFISHDLSVVKHISSNIAVMYLGQLVETSPSRKLFQKPCHPYTKALLSAVPCINIHAPLRRIVLQGEITSPIDPPQGCRFAARCAYAADRCRQPQPLEEVEPDHFVACCRARELNEALFAKTANA